MANDEYLLRAHTMRAIRCLGFEPNRLQSHWARLVEIDTEALTGRLRRAPIGSGRTTFQLAYAIALAETQNVYFRTATLAHADDLVQLLGLKGEIPQPRRRVFSLNGHMLRLGSIGPARPFVGKLIEDHAVVEHDRSQATERTGVEIVQDITAGVRARFDAERARRYENAVQRTMLQQAMSSSALSMDDFSRSLEAFRTAGVELEAPVVHPVSGENDSLVGIAEEAGDDRALVTVTGTTTDAADFEPEPWAIETLRETAQKIADSAGLRRSDCVATPADHNWGYDATHTRNHAIREQAITDLLAAVKRGEVEVLAGGQLHHIDKDQREPQPKIQTRKLRLRKAGT